MSMVWPTLGSRTAKEQNALVVLHSTIGLGWMHGRPYLGADGVKKG